jgi:hypothetical protein
MGGRIGRRRKVYGDASVRTRGGEIRGRGGGVGGGGALLEVAAVLVQPAGVSM